MTEQTPAEPAERATDETTVEPPVPQRLEAPAYYPPMTRGQHLAAALRGRPIIIAASVITTLAVGLGGFLLGLAVGHHDRDHGRFGPVMFERGGMPGGPGPQWGRGFGGPNGMMPPGLDDDRNPGWPDGDGQDQDRNG